jgi:serine/threonine protein kinase
MIIRILAKKSINSVLNEKSILEELSGDFIVNMRCAFQDRDNLYLVLDLLTGGDMRFHLCFFRKFNEEKTRFFAACIILALRTIHKNGYIHRDLKPENLVFDEKGFLKLTDFGIARKVHPENGKETSGTPGYMAPEVMCRQNHSFEVDFYALGVICYESMLGRRPYNGRSRKEIRDQILAKQVQIRLDEAPPGWSPEAVDFINLLIQRKPQRRLGANGVKEIMDHKWFKDFKWRDLESRSMAPPFIPNITDVFDYLRSLTEEDSEMEEEELAQNEILIRKKSVQGKLIRIIQGIR